MAAGDLATLEDVREHLQLQTQETEQDPVVQSLITGYSVAISRHCGREFAPAVATATRRFRLLPGDTHRGMYALGLAPYDLRAATSVQLNPETAAPVTLIAGSEYFLDPENPVDGVHTSLKIWPVRVQWTSPAAVNFGFAYVDITGAWGFEEVPEDVKQACVLAVTTAVRGDVQAFGGPLQPNSIGEGVNDAIALPPGVRGLLARYRRAPVL